MSEKLNLVEDINQAAVMAEAEDPKRTEATRLDKEYWRKFESHYAMDEADFAKNGDKYSAEIRDAEQAAEDAGETAGEMYKKIESLASRFHEDWRSDRLKEDGSYEPREKTTTDTEWISSHGTDIVDIANTEFADLPEDWQRENRIAAGVSQSLLEAGIESGEDTKSDGFVESASSEIHNQWLSRNEWAKGGELDVPYGQLPEDEKAKDRAQILTAIELSQS